MRSYGMKTKTLALATILLVTAFLLAQAVAPHTALADATWTNTGGGMRAYEITSLAYDSGHNLLYAGVNEMGVWRYDGTSWNDISGGALVYTYTVDSLAYDSTHNLLYAGCSNNTGGGEGVWKWNGTTWTDTGGGISLYRTYSLTYDSTHGVLYAGCYDYSGAGKGVWRYDGTTWTDTGGGVSSYSIYSLAYDSVHNILYAGTAQQGTWKYDGMSWTNTEGEVANNEVQSLAYDSVHNILYAGVGHPLNGVWKYDGTSWTNTEGGISSRFISSLAWDSTHNLLYAGTEYHGVWKYDGTSWTDTGGGVSTDTIQSLAFDSNHNILYASCDEGEYPYTGYGVWKHTAPTSTSFYFAEGYTGTNFQEYLCLGNPNTAAATANVTYMYSDGTTQKANYDVPATGRTTVNVNSAVGAGKEVSIQVQSDTPNLVAERPMYFNYQGTAQDNWTGGSDAIGATAPNPNWYFAEGNTLTSFDEYVTVQNPGDTPANLTFHYMVEGVGEKDASGQVGAHSRATFKTRDQIGSYLNESLYLSSDQAVVAERPMYFNYLGLALNNWTGGHDVVGTNSPASSWYLAEGTTRVGFEEWLCLENPGGSDVAVNATYQLGPGQGNPISKTYVIPAKQRLTVSVNQDIGANKDDSVQLTSTGSFIAERPMYFNYAGTKNYAWTGGHDVLGANASANNWFFAEGTTRDNFNEWLCLQNPGNADANATITYYTASGQAINKNWTVTANTRLTVNVNQDVGANQDISAKVSSDQPIIVERPMYFDYQGVWTGGHDVVGFTQE